MTVMEKENASDVNDDEPYAVEMMDMRTMMRMITWNTRGEGRREKARKKKEKKKKGM